MEVAQKEWKKFANKMLLNNLYKGGENKKINNFLKDYNLSEINVLNKEPCEFKLKILFEKDDKIFKIIAKSEPKGWHFYWYIPTEYDFFDLGQILEEFDFRSYVV